MSSSNITTKSVFDDLSGGMFLTDRNGEAVYANKAMEEKTGFAVGEIIGKTPGALWGGNMDKAFYGYLWQTIRDKKQPFISAVMNRRKSGGLNREYIHIAPILENGGEAKYFLELLPDIPDSGQGEKFQNEFQNVFSKQLTHKNSTLKWMLPWLGGSASVEQGSQELHDFFASALVCPTREDYLARGDDKILILAAQKDSSEFSLLYQKYKTQVFNYFIHRVGHDQNVTEELAQETFLRAFRYLSSFRVSNASYRTYLLRIAHNILANFFRQKSSLSLEDLPESFIKIDGGYEDFLLKDTMWEAVKKLSDIEQQVLNMKYHEGLSVREIATVLQKSENAVKLHLSRARKKLKELV